MTLPRASVRVRVTLVAAGLFAVALTLASFVLVRVVHNNLSDDIERTNQQQLDRIASQLANGVDPDSLEVPAGGPGGAPAFRVTGPGGRPIDVPALPGPRGPGRFPGDNPVVRAQRVVQTARGTITLVAERSLVEVDRSVDSVTRVLAFGVPLLVALVAALTWWLTGRALRPVEAIRAETTAISGSTIHRRVPEPQTDDEIGRLARTMNSMLDRLEDASLRQRRFVSDASHELRSPVASIRAQLEVALRRPDADWPAVAEKVLEEDARLEGAVSELLELARSEEGAPLEPVEVDLDEVVLEETRRSYRVPVDTKRVSAGRVHGSGAQLARAVRNLLDNAARHARSRVEVGLATVDGSVVLAVDDDGPGVSTADRDRVFERFTRLDEGRARDAGGVGLGLSMVRAIVDRHAGTVSVDDSPLGGARFLVQLPRPDPDSERVRRRMPPTLSLATFNTHYGVRPARHPPAESYDMERAVRSLEADVVVLQEVWRPDRRRGPVDAAAAALGYDVHYEATGPATADARWPHLTRTGSGESGIAVLSRIPVRRLAAPAVGPTFGDPAPQRRALDVELDVHGVPVRLIAIHLTSRLPHGPPIQLRRLGRALPAAGTPAIVAGDCNFWGPAVEALLPGWRRVVRGRTWPASAPHSQIDHVLVRPADMEAVGGRVLADVGSDHRPVRVDLVVRGQR